MCGPLKNKGLGVNWDESPVPFSCHHGVTNSVNKTNKQNSRRSSIGGLCGTMQFAGFEITDCSIKSFANPG